MSQDRHPTEDLPAYALGALDKDEREVIAAHVETCATCAATVAEFEEALYEVAAIGATGAGAQGAGAPGREAEREATVDPPTDLRTRIVLRHRGVRVPSATSWADRLIEFLRRPVPAAVPIALAILLVVAFGVVGGSRQQADTYARALAGVADGRVVALAPTGANPDARAAVVIPTQGSPYLIVRLPAPPAGKAWEAWVLKAGTSGPVAVPAGIAERGDVFTLSLTAPLGAGDGVAVTLEPASGSVQPTTQPVLVIEKT